MPWHPKQKSYRELAPTCRYTCVGTKQQPEVQRFPPVALTGSQVAWWQISCWVKTQASMWGAWEERIGRDSTRRGGVEKSEYSQGNGEACDRKQASLQLDHRPTGTEEVGVMEKLVQAPEEEVLLVKFAAAQHPGSSFWPRSGHQVSICSFRRPENTIWLIMYWSQQPKTWVSQFFSMQIICIKFNLSRAHDRFD